MVGIGTQDSLKGAQSFLTRHKIATVKLLWDATGTSWVKLGVPSQPAWVLIATDGTVLDSNVGTIPYTAVLKAI